MNKLYIIINTNGITEEMINESLCFAGNQRMNNTGEVSILSFCSKCLKTIEGYVKYSHEDIKAFLHINKATWEPEE